jgi:hypothetical protein
VDGKRIEVEGRSLSLQSVDRIEKVTTNWPLTLAIYVPLTAAVTIMENWLLFQDPGGGFEGQLH